MIGKQFKREDTVQCNLVGAKSLEGLCALGRLGLEGLLLLLTTWKAAERFFAEDFSFLFDNTSLCYLCVCISLPLIFAF